MFIGQLGHPGREVSRAAKPQAVGRPSRRGEHAADVADPVHRDPSIAVERP
ncbi:MAG: hypothetical protein ACXVFT_16855 [Solirubrobacteraceae bacterium]